MFASTIIPNSPESMPITTAMETRVKANEGEQGNLAKLASVLLSFSEEGNGKMNDNDKDGNIVEDSKERLAKEVGIPSITLSRLSPSPSTTSDMIPTNRPLLAPAAAYAKLQGPTWEYYVHKLAVVLGKSPNIGATDGDGVDVFLGLSESISRKHLRIEYNPHERRWELYCFGKAGVKVDNVHYDPFCYPVPLTSQAQIKVEDAEFYFLLPLNEARKRLPTNGNLNVPKRVRKLKNNTTDNNNNNNRRKRAISSASDQSETALDPSDMIPPSNLIKPTASYACLIAEAIRSTSEKKMTLSSIYKYLSDKYPYFRFTKNGWQNSIRHNLSLNKAFKKVPRASGEPGKGMFWVIDSGHAHLVDGGHNYSSAIISSDTNGRTDGNGVDNGSGINNKKINNGRNKSLKLQPIRSGYGSAPTTPPIHMYGKTMNFNAGSFVPILPTRPFSASPALLAPQLLEAAAAMDNNTEQFDSYSNVERKTS